MAGGAPVLKVASAARTATGNTAALTLSERGQRLAATIDATAVSGTTPSLTLTVEWSQDGGVTFAQGDPADTFTAITATGTKVKDFQIKSDTYRYVWTITGTTPSFTFSIRDYVANPA